MHLMEATEIKYWSEAEKEVWRLEETYWQNFSKGDIEGMLASWHEDFCGWPVNASMPENREDSKVSLEKLLKNARIVSFELIPQVNIIHGELAFFHYLVDAEIKNSEGKMLKVLFRVVHTWTNEGKEWKLIGGLSAT